MEGKVKSIFMQIVSVEDSQVGRASLEMHINVLRIEKENCRQTVLIRKYVYC